MENITQKKFLDKEIFRETKQEPIKWSDIKHIEFEDNDIIVAEFVESFHSENNGWDAHYSCRVIRKILETDQEFEERQRRLERNKKWAKERRYESYLKLKKEFENQ